MALSLRKSFQEIFVVTNGYSASRAMDRDAEYEHAWSLDMIRSLDHNRFIELCAEYFEEKGYRTTINTQHDKKYINIWLFKESYSSTNPFGIIQCWETKAIKVDTEDFSLFEKIVVKNKVPLGVFITAGKFSEQVANKKDKKLKIIDGEGLLKVIRSLPEIRNQRLLDRITQAQ